MKKRSGTWPGFLGDTDTAAVVPVNGLVDKVRYAEMKSGTAKQAAGIWSELRRGAGILLDTCGQHTMVVPVIRQQREWTVIFPMKHLVRSAEELAALANAYGWTKVWLPPEFMDLSKSDKATLNTILDDRFVVMYDPEAHERKQQMEAEKAERRKNPKPKFKRVGAK